VVQDLQDIPVDPVMALDLVDMVPASDNPVLVDLDNPVLVDQ